MPLFLTSVVIILFLLGLLGTVIPGLPGIGLIFAGVLVYTVATGFTAITMSNLLLFTLVAAASLAINYAGSMLGARAGGGKGWAVGGTIVGALLGAATFGPLGLFVGAWLGALAGALYEGQSGAAARKAAFYSVLGLIGGTLVQFVLGVSMIVAFVMMVV